MDKSELDVDEHQLTVNLYELLSFVIHSNFIVQ